MSISLWNMHETLSSDSEFEFLFEMWKERNKWILRLKINFPSPISGSVQLPEAQVSAVTKTKKSHRYQALAEIHTAAANAFELFSS